MLLDVCDLALHGLEELVLLILAGVGLGRHVHEVLVEELATVCHLVELRLQGVTVDSLLVEVALESLDSVLKLIELTGHRLEKRAGGRS